MAPTRSAPSHTSQSSCLRSRRSGLDVPIVRGVFGSASLGLYVLRSESESSEKGTCARSRGVASMASVPLSGVRNSSSLLSISLSAPLPWAPPLPFPSLGPGCVSRLLVTP